MLLASRCRLRAAAVGLTSIADRACLVVERFDRERTEPSLRVHQEDLCQALGLTPDFKYQLPGWRVPSFSALSNLLDEHSPFPGLDRIAAAKAAVFNFLIGNADAHAKNIALLYTREGVRLAPLYDLVSTACYPDLSTELAMGIGDELDPNAITSMNWADLAADFGLNAHAFEHVRREQAATVFAKAEELRDEARVAGWHRPILDQIVDVIGARRAQL
ncbi:MAG TPA: HipA domain-containing protein [Solirubrobacteraceae bacterium]|nr:HipA domain-containing protein [Solirubrobacteraceae bacterium]